MGKIVLLYYEETAKHPVYKLNMSKQEVKEKFPFTVEKKEKTHTFFDFVEEKGLTFVIHILLDCCKRKKVSFFRTYVSALWNRFYSRVLFKIF